MNDVHNDLISGAHIRASVYLITTFRFDDKLHVSYKLRTKKVLKHWAQDVLVMEIEIKNSFIKKSFF
jgi:hypothetical protein